MMSTRSILAFETEKGIRGVYVHCDGYPEGEWGRLNQFSQLVARDGISKVAATVLAHSHWSHLLVSNAYVEGHPPPSHEIPLDGYGAYFEHVDRDRYFTPDQLKEWWDSEYVYLVNPLGEIRWADIGVGHDDLTWDSLEWNQA
jgi:hypothetical protein